MNGPILTEPSDIANLLTRAEAAGAGHLRELIRPAIRGELNISFPARGTRMPPLYRLAKQGRPIVIVIGDDDYQPAGPSTWACADKLRSWAGFAIVHGTGAQALHYTLAAQLAIDARRLLLIETTSVAAHDWAAFLHARTPELRFMGFLPRDGAHPVMPARSEVH